MPKEKTMHELAKEFPEKTYRELENYRDADRHQEARQIPLTESQQQQEELEPIGTHIAKGVCVTGALRKDRDVLRTKRPINQVMKPQERIKELEEALANALAINEAHQHLNGALQERLTKADKENKKMHDHLHTKMDSARKAGL